jgi:crotonobetainyl-CoA:carnitine CoA-transferase CaiB-like acyl-CoA transferase
MAAPPLAGLLAVDLSRLLPGPLAARLLADLGARVIKVEEPTLGDPVRRAPPLVRGRGALAAMLLAGVESIALDLKRPAAREVLAALLGRADVLLASFRPGGLARLGFPPAELAARFPRLVVCSLTGYGEDGPEAERAGHDLTYQALAGCLAATAAMPAAPVADVVGAWSAVAAILAALLERERSGRGASIDASLYDAALHTNLAAWAAEAGGAKEVGEALPLSGALPCYGLYRTADGAYLALAALEERFWRRFCRAVGRGDLVRRQYSSDPAVRREVAAVVAGRSRGDWERLLAAEDLPWEFVRSAAEAAAHPQAAARRVLVEGPDSLPRLAFPARLNGARPAAAAAVPEPGEQTAAILAELDLAASRLPPRARRALGIGRRPSARRWLLRLASAVRPVLR